MPEPVYFDQCELLTREDGSLFELGAGGHTTTYKGFHTGLQAPVVLKIIHSDCLAEDGARQRFAAAARKAMLLHHRHIASIFHYGEEGGNCFFTMEYVDGKSLEAVLKREGNLPIEQALEIVGQVAKALHAGWLQQMIHGDLRPTKLILMDDDDDATVVKVVDCGLTRWSFSRSAIGSGAVAASAYASPEQRERREVDERSDIYSLGLILWEMLSGEKPDPRLPQPMRPEKINALMQPLVPLLRRMLQADPAQRQQTPGELLQEIEQELDRRAAAGRAAATSVMESVVLPVSAASIISAAKPAPQPAPPQPAPSQQAQPQPAPPPVPPPVPKPVLPPVLLPTPPSAPPQAVPPPPVSPRAVPPQPVPPQPMPLQPTPPVETPREEVETDSFPTVVEDVAVRPPEIPRTETPAVLSEAHVQTEESKNVAPPVSGGEWETPPEEKPRLLLFAALAILVLFLGVGYFGYAYYHWHAAEEPNGFTVAEPGQRSAPGKWSSPGEPTPEITVKPSTPAPRIQPTPVRTPAPVSQPTPAPVTTPPPSTPSPVVPSIPSTPSIASAPENAAKHTPFVNSLGQEFVPVPETHVLFCRWPTRVSDWTAFVKEAGEPNTPGMNVVRVKKQKSGDWDMEYEVDMKATWKNPGFTQTGDHPVVGVSWNDAHRFCAWLSQKESRTYRLPTDAEWTAAVGQPTYPWGELWPPPKGAGNYWDEAAVANLPGKGWAKVPGNDGYAFTSPVGSFQPNALGLYDMGGNVWQWCEDEYRESMNNPELLPMSPRPKKSKEAKGATSRVLRGASWFDASRVNLNSAFRQGERLTVQCSDIGFRCVLVLPEAAPAPPR